VPTRPRARRSGADKDDDDSSRFSRTCCIFSTAGGLAPFGQFARILRRLLAVAMQQKLLIVTAMSFDRHSNIAHNTNIEHRADSRPTQPDMPGGCVVPVLRLR
jgi:hypothetical protein